MTTIDVNTGGYVGNAQLRRHDLQDQPRGVPGDRAPAALRNLGGIIIVDFIDMMNVEHRDAVLAEFRRLSPGRTRMTVSGFTQLGLVEMTRKRTPRVVAHILCDRAAMCQGRGEVKTARTVCFEILREILREARQFDETREFRILASQTVIDLFLEEESQALACCRTSSASRCRCRSSRSTTQEQYDIVADVAGR